MAGRMLQVKITLIGEALAQYEDYLARVRASSDQQVTDSEFNVGIWRAGMTILIETVNSVEEERRYC